jgi:hypothetical protein
MSATRTNSAKSIARSAALVFRHRAFRPLVCKHRTRWSSAAGNRGDACSGCCDDEMSFICSCRNKNLGSWDRRRDETTRVPSVVFSSEF